MKNCMIKFWPGLVAFFLIVGYLNQGRASILSFFVEDPIKFSVKTHFGEENKTIHFEYEFKNNSDDDYLLVFHMYPIVLYKASPEALFAVENLKAHPKTAEDHQPADKENVVLLKAKSTYVKKDWVWVDGFSLFMDHDGRYAEYKIAKPGKVELTFQYHGTQLSNRFGFPETAKWLTDKLTADPVAIEFP